jgi:hypothetical protein
VCRYSTPFLTSKPHFRRFSTFLTSHLLPPLNKARCTRTSSPAFGGQVIGQLHISGSTTSHPSTSIFCPLIWSQRTFGIASQPHCHQRIRDFSLLQTSHLHHHGTTAKQHASTAVLSKIVQVYFNGFRNCRLIAKDIRVLTDTNSKQAVWEMTQLIIAPKKVFRNIYYHVSPLEFPL